MSEKQVVSKQRVADHGEVYTGKKEVNAMLDLVGQETDRIESRFLEPACGIGNFLIEILNRKLEIVKARYAKSQLEFERYAILAVSSLYGIDLLEDNISQCRRNLLRKFEDHYLSLYMQTARRECIDSVSYILEKNIVQGDALTMQTSDVSPKSIVFSEWSPVNGSMLKRRDFEFHELMGNSERSILPIFSYLKKKDRFFPDPIKEYKLVHFLKVADAET